MLFPVPGLAMENYKAVYIATSLETKIRRREQAILEITLDCEATEDTSTIDLGPQNLHESAGTVP